MWKKIAFAAAAVLLLCGLVLFVKFAVRPRAIPKIKISTFDSPLVLANSIKLRLREEIKNAPLLLIGLYPKRDHIEAAQQLLFSLNEPGMRYDSLLNDTTIVNLVAELKTGETVNLETQLKQIAPTIQKAIGESQRVVILMAAVQSSQLLEHSLANKLKNQFGLKPTSITFAAFPRRREDEGNMQIPCLVDVIDTTGQGKLGCEILQTARLNYRKKMQPNKFVGLVNQVGLNDYLVLFDLEPVP